MRIWKRLFAAATVVLLGACGGSGQGTLRVEIYGEDFIEQGIPASNFADGWSVHFDAFLVCLGAVEGAGVRFDGTKIFDLTQPGPVEVASGPADSGPIALASYGIVPADSNAQNVNARTEDVQAMVQGGYSVYVVGTATRDASTIRFSWGFDSATRYENCHAVHEVPDGGVGVMQITVHGDHLFMDSLVEEEPSLRFQPIADADADGDGQVTADELEAVSGTAFEALDHYDVAPSSGIDDLWSYLAYLATTIGHIDGEGHCGE